MIGANGGSTNFGFALGVNYLVFTGLGIDLAYDYERTPGGGHTGILGAGARLDFHFPFGQT